MSAELIADLDEAMIAGGVDAFTVSEAARCLGRTEKATRSHIHRLLAAGRLFSPARGLYVAIPAEYRSWGVVPASWFVDSMMRHLGCRYYVGLLSAAEVHGAAHQRPQIFQVIVERPVADRDLGRVQLRTYEKQHLDDTNVVRVNTHTGSMAVSTPELTVVDMAARLNDVGGLDRLATVIVELAGDDLLRAASFARLARSEPAAALRRAGWLVEHVTDLRLDELGAALGHAEPVRLDPHAERRGSVDRRWGVRINADVEVES